MAVTPVAFSLDKTFVLMTELYAPVALSTVTAEPALSTVMIVEFVLLTGTKS